MPTLTGLYPPELILDELERYASLDFRPPAPLHFWAETLEARQIAVAGDALMRKVREQVAVSGAYQAARNLRKQGFSLQVALAIVAGRF